jgi:hypothetical protein
VDVDGNVDVDGATGNIGNVLDRPPVPG